MKLEKQGFLRKRENSGNYSTVRSRMRLIRNDIDGSQQSDLKYVERCNFGFTCSYVTSGYAPLSARIVQAAALNTSPLEDVAKVIGFEYSSVSQRITSAPEKNVILVAVLGGLSYMEVSAIRLIEKQNPDIEFVFLTTNMTKRSELVKSMVVDSLPEQA